MKFGKGNKTLLYSCVLMPNVITHMQNLITDSFLFHLKEGWMFGRTISFLKYIYKECGDQIYISNIKKIKLQKRVIVNTEHIKPDIFAKLFEPSKTVPFS